jgi:oxygen-independent coproporphyrinogen-3 oxidase
VETFDRTLDLVLAIRPERLAIYNYAHLPARFKGQRMINDADIPSPQTKLDILHHTIDKLGSSDLRVHRHGSFCPAR